ncbi:hypothetical protein M9H77_29764 [Catharanthus roseus]|uniref:Uncharacterized protein n=1 Tax=Catharanthus roseus TaxID=4058 RepID=A0ACB9ZXX6_CATRO|nr:hypothetical protein M9H77_29764 [Catharanthus roseus]
MFLSHHDGNLDTYTRTMKKRAVSRRDDSLKKKHVSLSTSASSRFLGIKHGNSIYIVVILEYLASKDYGLDGNGMRDKKKNMIIYRHMLLAMRNDQELEKLLACVTIAHGGILPKQTPFFRRRMN